MKEIRFLLYIYVYSLGVLAIAALLRIDYQTLIRIPFINIRFIDLAIIIIFIKTIPTLVKNLILKNSKSVLSYFIVSILFFELIQLVRTYGSQDLNSQLGLLFGTINITIIVFAAQTLNVKNVKVLLREFSVLVSLAIILMVSVKIYGIASFNGITKYAMGQRVMFAAKGINESISNSVIYPFVFLCGLYRNEIFNKSERIVKTIVAIGALFTLVQLVIAFHRGQLITIALILVFYIYNRTEKYSHKNILKRVFELVVFILIGYVLAYSFFYDYGYDPLVKIEDTIDFTVNIDNPSWDKGRSISISIAINAWLENIWLGYGYDSLYNHGLMRVFATAHNYIITSLFHRGILGTSIYLILILVILKRIKNLWRMRNYYADKQLTIILILTILLWFIPFMTQEIIFERYSTSVQYFYIGCALVFLQNIKIKIYKKSDFKRISSNEI